VNGVRIHVLSDLHCEFEPYTPSLAATEADVVVLAGDINVKARGVAWARETFDCPVVYVAGNHEYYGGHLDTTMEKMRAESCDRVRVMDNDEWIIGGVRFLGATGWIDYTSTGDSRQAKMDAYNGLNDYKKIRAAGYRKLQASDLVLRNHASLAWLRERLAEPFDGATVVVTHYAPSMFSIDGNTGDDVEHWRNVEQWRKIQGSGGGRVGSTYINERAHLDASYANSWESLMDEHSVLWIHGHTHHAISYNCGISHVVSNPRGYPGEFTGFDPDFLIYYGD
jgi:Icc-related predicted phosphoesterase